MALIYHRATVIPEKLDLLRAWLPTQQWYDGTGELDRVATFRIDDPAGKVGTETFVVGSAGKRFHVPMTYRSETLDGGRLVGETEHSVLGHRYVYDGETDPVYLVAATALITGAGHEEDRRSPDGTQLDREPWAARVTGSGGDIGDGGSLVLARTLPGDVPDGVATMSATWRGQDEPVVLAWLPA